MSKVTYLEKLKDPRWQKKRLEIMQRDEFMCRKCFDKGSTFNVHHKYYIYNNDPWDYPDELLITLCEKCHDEEEESKYIINDFAKVLLSYGYLASELIQLLELIRKLPAGDSGMDYIYRATLKSEEDYKIFKELCP
jgi:5-methylcytosine-specific restriction endonuclease McrA